MAELVGQACSPLLEKPACPLWLTLVPPPSAQPRHGTAILPHQWVGKYTGADGMKNTLPWGAWWNGRSQPHPWSCLS